MTRREGLPYIVVSQQWLKLMGGDYFSRGNRYGTRGIIHHKISTLMHAMVQIIYHHPCYGVHSHLDTELIFHVVSCN